jgi:uncharacterized protein (TIGR02266 family)
VSGSTASLDAREKSDAGKAIEGAAPFQAQALRDPCGRRRPFVIRVDYGTVDEIFSDFTTNINEGGIFIETTKVQLPGSPVRLEFSFPGATQPVRVSGRVVWVRKQSQSADGPPGLGVQFEDLSRETKDQINEIVKNLRTD